MGTIICVIAIIFTSKAQIIGNCYYYPTNVLPTPIFKHQTVYLENQNCIYLFGGQNEVGTSHIVYKWNLSSPTDGFINITTTPQSKNFYSWTNSVVSIGNIAYFVGMHDGSQDSGLIHMFDMQQESWIDNSNLATMPVPSTFGCLAANSSHIFMIGGYKGSGIFPVRARYHNFLQIYDIQSNIWILFSIPFISEWSDQYCSMVDNTLFVFGGYTYEGTCNSCYQMWTTNIMYKWVWNEWTSLGTKLTSTRSGTTAYYNNIIYIIGGGIGGNDRDLIETFDVTSESITKTLSNSYRMLDPLWYLSSVVVGNAIYIIGGRGSNDFISQNVQICDLTSANPTSYPTISPTLQPTGNPTVDPTVEPTYNPIVVFRTTYNLETMNSTTAPISEKDDIDNIFNFREATFTQIIIGTSIIILCCCCPLLIGVGFCFIYYHRRKPNLPTESSMMDIKLSNSKKGLKPPGLSDQDSLKIKPGLKDTTTINTIELSDIVAIRLPSQYTVNMDNEGINHNELTAFNSTDKKILNNALEEVLDEKKINLNSIDSGLSDGMYDQNPQNNNNEIENEEKMSLQNNNTMFSEEMYNPVETKNEDIIHAVNKTKQLNNNKVTKHIGAV